MFILSMAGNGCDHSLHVKNNNCLAYLKYNNDITNFGAKSFKHNKINGRVKY
jgi:hypothetical protein